MAYEFDTTVLEDLHVTIEFDVCRDHCVEDISVSAVGGRECRRTVAMYIENRMAKSDHMRVYEQAVEHLADCY